MKKKILITLLIIIVIALIGVGYFVFTDMMQEDKLKTELSELNDLVNAEFIDANKLQVTYLSGKDFIEVTEILDLDMKI